MRLVLRAGALARIARTCRRQARARDSPEAKLVRMASSDITSGAGVSRRHVFAPGIVYTTVGSLDDAKLLARALVDAKMAACVQLKDIVSIYAWGGTVEEEKEVRVHRRTGSE
jgi:hypothetical protein